MAVYQVRRQTPQALDLGEIERAMIAKQNRHDKAIEAENQLKATISALDFNEAEGEFRDQLYNQINTVIEQNAENGYMGNAYDDILKLTGNIVSNPGINARLKAQQEYKAYQKSIDDSDLPDQYKQYYKAKNAYHYNDIYDKNGKVIGGSTWTPNSSPVEQMDYFKVFNEAIKNIKPDTFSNTVLRYKDKNGNVKSNWSEGDELVWYDAVTNKTQTVDKEAVKKAVNAYVDTHPEVLASLQQDRDVAFWASNTDGQESYFKSKDNTGVKLTLNQFKDEVFNKYINAHDYQSNIRTVDINKDYASNIAKLKESETKERLAQIKAAQAELEGSVTYSLPSTGGVMTVIRDTNNIQDATVKREVSGQLNNLYKDIYKTDYVGDILDFNNFQSIINKEQNPLVKGQLQSKYDEIILSYGESIMNNNRILADDSNAGYRAAVEFQSDRLSGNSFNQNGSEEYNKLVDEWNDIINTFFPEDTQKVKFNIGAENVYNEFKKLVRNDYSKYGIQFDDNYKSIILDKEYAKYLPEVSALLSSSFNVERMFQPNNSNVELIDENGSANALTMKVPTNHIGTGNIIPMSIPYAINDILNLSKSLDKSTAPIDEVLLEERIFTGASPSAAIAQAAFNGHHIGDKYEGQTQDQLQSTIVKQNEHRLNLIANTPITALKIKKTDRNGVTTELNYKESKNFMDEFKKVLAGGTNAPKFDAVGGKIDRIEQDYATRVTIGGEHYDILGVQDPEVDTLVDKELLLIQNDIDGAIQTDRIITLGYLGNKPITFEVDSFKQGNIAIRENISDNDPYIASKFNVINMNNSDIAYYDAIIKTKRMHNRIMSFREIINKNKLQDGSINLNQDYIDSNIAPVVISYIQSLNLLARPDAGELKELLQGIEYQLGTSLKSLNINIE